MYVVITWLVITGRLFAMGRVVSLAVATQKHYEWKMPRNVL